MTKGSKGVHKLTAFDEDATASSNSSVLQNDTLADNLDVTRVFGIDLGTTNSAISIVKQGITPEAIKLLDGKYTMPSCLMWHDGAFVAGWEAYTNRAKPNVIYSVKRMMQTPGAIVRLVDGEASITMSPPEVSAEILRGLVAQTGGVYGEIKDVIVTVPAYFNQIGRDNTRKACELAGLHLIALENEPSAAAIQYDINPETGTSEDILIFDFGGGTFDVTLARITDNSSMVEAARMFGLYYNGGETGKTVEPLAIGGDPHLGGDDIDIDLFKILCRKIGIDPKKISIQYTKQCLLRLEQLKKKGVTDTAYIFKFNTVLTDGMEINKDIMITEEDFVNALLPSYNRMKKITNEVLDSVPNDVRKIILVGGSTKSPLLVRLLKRDYGSYEINNAFDPDLSVTRGAAIKGKILKYGNSNIHVFDILPIDIGVLEHGEVVPLIERNTSLPTVKEVSFTTTIDNQTSVAMKLFQGNSVYPEECVSLGELVIDGIAKREAGKPRLVAKICISADSLMTCIASIDGKSKEIKLNLSGDTESMQRGLTRDEKQMVRWRARARALGGDAGSELNMMLDRYPIEVTREQIIDFIKENCRLQSV